MCEVKSTPLVIYKEANPDPNTIKDPQNGNFYYCYGNKHLFIYMCKWIQITTPPPLLEVKLSNINTAPENIFTFTATIKNVSASSVTIASVNVSNSVSGSVTMSLPLPQTINSGNSLIENVTFQACNIGSGSIYWFTLFDNKGEILGAAFFET